MLKSFFKQIISNLKDSNKIFYKHNSDIYLYKTIYLKLLKINYFLNKIKKKEIILFSDKSIGYYTVVLAIFLSGNTWIQISPNIPLHRIKKIIKFSNVKFGIYDQSFNNKKIFNIKNIKIIELDQILKTEKLEPFNNLKNIKKNDISCIFFTSGSSGEPKGVKLSYENVISCALYQINNLGYKKYQNFTDCHETSFVMSLNIIFPATYLNCSISPLISFSEKLDPFTFFNDNKIDNLITVPSFILFNKEKIREIKLKNLILCGESFNARIMNILDKNSQIKNIYNLYGATELSPWAFFYKLRAKDKNLIRKKGSVPIGKPFDKISYKFNDLNELIISGSVVSNGYLNNSKETDKKFKKIAGINSYNTGDVGYKESGLVFIKGRNDSQVKIRGYRIDLAEIENISRSFKGILFTFCFVKKDKLTLIYNCEKEEQTKNLYSFLKKKVPSYMVPSKIIFIKNIPSNKNGKIDRVKLKNI
jgi:D-alanine--poly(phosphoribitol) ligase subunit 1